MFESPLQMLSDSPSNYMREPEMMESLAPVPRCGTIQRCSTLASPSMLWSREKSGKDWYVGAMNNWTGREEVDFSFLPAGTFSLEARNGVDANRIAGN